MRSFRLYAGLGMECGVVEMSDVRHTLWLKEKLSKRCFYCFHI
jgi:hypothetical protein